MSPSSPEVGIVAVVKIGVIVADGARDAYDMIDQSIEPVGFLLN